MIVDERVAGYLRALEPEQPEYLARLEERAIREDVPIIRKDAQALLRFFLRMKRPMRILEVGTAVGYSCLYMSEYMPEQALIATVEKVPMRLRPAKENLKNAPRAERIALLVGDAADVLAVLADGRVEELEAALSRGAEGRQPDARERESEAVCSCVAEAGQPDVREEETEVVCSCVAEDQQPDVIEEESEAVCSCVAEAGYPDVIEEESEAARKMLPAPGQEHAQWREYGSRPEKPMEIYLPAGERSAWRTQSFSEPYDFIFLDAAKGQYMNFLPYLLRLLKPDGMLVTDNVLQEGSVADSKFALARRERTIHKRMREYLYELTHRDGLNTAVFPVGDGMAVTTFR